LQVTDQESQSRGRAPAGAARSHHDRDPAAAAEIADPIALAVELAALRHEIALRDEFIATAAHELRNPISPVYMQLEHLKESISAMQEPIAKPWLMAQLAAMTGRLDRFLETLDRLLDASRLGAGHLVLLPGPCDLVEIARAVLHASERELTAAGCTAQLDAPASATGWWDRLRIEQVIGNLLSNAIRYGAGQPISIAIATSPDEVLLTIKDRGIGIPADDLPKIFVRFERARNVGRSAGLGLGLWIVAELCRAMGGQITVASELGKGATFTVALPRRS
jgi:signal transduction histidine kinase